MPEQEHPSCMFVLSRMHCNVTLVTIIIYLILFTLFNIYF